MTTKFKICTRCHGKGTHVNPAIDGNGISADEMDRLDQDDGDFRQNYIDGVFDIACLLCKGQRVLEDTPEADAERRLDAEWAAEQRAESGMLGEF